MLSDFGIEKRLSESSQLCQRAFFVDPHQAARAHDIRRQNGRQSPLYVLAAQDAPPGRGKLNAYIIEFWSGVRLGPCPRWVNCGVLAVGRSLPVFPDQLTFLVFVGMSQTCDKLKCSLPNCGAGSGQDILHLARYLRNTSVNRSGLVCGGMKPRYSPLRPIR